MIGGPWSLADPFFADYTLNFLHFERREGQILYVAVALRVVWCVLHVRFVRFDVFGRVFANLVSEGSVKTGLLVCGGIDVNDKLGSTS